MTQKFLPVEFDSAFNPSTLHPKPTDPALKPPAIAAPSRINIMQGTYRPAPAPVMRPGSDDHTRLPSLRQGQRVPFVAGYIPL